MNTRLTLSAALLLAASAAATLCNGSPARNPVIWADVPDPAVIRVGEVYYMSSTTMHMSPGLPIMKSSNLVDWELVGYAYDELGENDALELRNGENAYGRGSWASSLRHHEGVFYASTFSATTGKTHIYKTRNIEKGSWEEISFRPSLHDHSLFFDDDGRVYMVYDGGNIRLVELEKDLSGIKADGTNKVVIENAHAVAGGEVMLPAEGSQLRKIDGKYYLMNITWPRDDMRTAIVHRADSIEGPYEGRVALRDKGVAQGCLIDTPDGDWYAFLFRDFGAVGRVPYLVPVKWSDGWPVLGVDGEVPVELDIPSAGEGLANLVASDEFERKKGLFASGKQRRRGLEWLPLAWQWNHNPDARFWSLADRRGWLRLQTARVDESVLQARNMLTQRTFGPTSSAEVKLDASRLKDGDVAGLIALQKHYGLVGIESLSGETSLVMRRVLSEEAETVERVPLEADTVRLRIDCDFRDRRDIARFYYSYDGASWKEIGEPLQMRYTLPHFMGYRFGLFNYATQEAGGVADFDYYRIGDALLEGE